MNIQITKLRKEWQIEIKLKQERDEQQRKYVFSLSVSKIFIHYSSFSPRHLVT